MFKDSEALTFSLVTIGTVEQKVLSSVLKLEMDNLILSSTGSEFMTVGATKQNALDANSKWKSGTASSFMLIYHAVQTLDSYTNDRWHRQRQMCQCRSSDLILWRGAAVMRYCSLWSSSGRTNTVPVCLEGWSQIWSGTVGGCWETSMRVGFDHSNFDDCVLTAQ